MPDTAPMLPERKTPLADVRGPQTAVVVGAEGEEIDCDEYGRILVRFHWDLDKANSMRCRVSQSWAGNGWGGMVIPRVGMEVVVEFLDGDPDQPLVTGCVYNGHSKVPYELPANKTRSTFRTDTHKGAGFNELRFEDEAGREEIYVHAQKDRNEKVQNNHSERIDNNWIQSVGHNKRIEVEGSHSEIIGGNYALQVGPSAIAHFISRTMTMLLGGVGKAAYRLGIPGILSPGEGSATIVIEKNKAEVVGLTSSEVAGFVKEIIAGRRIVMRSGETIEMESRDGIDVIADQTITLSCGASSITLQEDGTITFIGNKTVFEMNEHFKVKSGRVDLN